MTPGRVSLTVDTVRYRIGKRERRGVASCFLGQRVIPGTKLKAYVQKAHAFTANPPKGAQTLTRRNGDKLIYDPRGNVFAVVTKEGAPRTMFKPDDGAAYWEKVKAGEAKARTRRASSRKDDDQT